VRAVLLDVDDTLTTDGKLTAQAFSTLERLKDAGKRVVPVTAAPRAGATTSPACGRSTRWWGKTAPSISVFFEKTLVRRFHDEPATRARNRRASRQSPQALLRRFPDARSLRTRPIARPIWRSTTARTSRPCAWKRPSGLPRLCGRRGYGEDQLDSRERAGSAATTSSP